MFFVLGLVLAPALVLVLVPEDQVSLLTSDRKHIGPNAHAPQSQPIPESPNNAIQDHKTSMSQHHV